MTGLGDLAALVVESTGELSAADLWACVDRVLVHDGVPAGRLAIERHGAGARVDDQVPFDTSYSLNRPNVGHLASKLVDGSSLVVRDLSFHIDTIGELCGRIEARTGLPAEVDAVVLAPGSVHVDPAERGGPVVLIPMDLTLGVTVDGLDRPDAPAGEAVVAQPGQELRVRGQALGICLRAVVSSSSVERLRAETAGMARFHPLLRADLPTDLDAPVESYGGSLYARPGAFHAEVAAALGAEPLRRTVARLRTSLPSRSTVGLLANREALRGELPSLRSCIPGGFELTVNGETASLTAGGTTVILATEMAAALEPHLHGDRFDPTPIVAAFEPDPEDGSGPASGSTPLPARIRMTSPPGPRTEPSNRDTAPPLAPVGAGAGTSPESFGSPGNRGPLPGIATPSDDSTADGGPVEPVNVALQTLRLLLRAEIVEIAP